MKNEHYLETSKFLVNDKPYCVTDWDLQQRNLDFVKNLNPSYFRYVAEIGLNGLSSEEKMNPALLLRTTYSHALETFISLTGAAIQAPDCVPGWILKYGQNDLEGVAMKLERGAGLKSKLNLPAVTWDGFAKAVMSHVPFDSEAKKQSVIDGFSKSWRMFSSDFSNGKMYKEYNSIKHGFRVSAGGFSLSIGEEPSLGVSPPAESMWSLGGSTFGTSFFVPEGYGNTKYHFRIRSFSRNWAPENLFQGLLLLELSMNNILSFLKLVLGEKAGTAKFSWPKNENDFMSPWKKSVGVTDMNFDLEVRASDIPSVSEQEIMDAYSVT